ncbi:MAG: PHP domain-containing protein [Spirochaetaceae bacterium]|nr:PHP domain-containing protein [Spirochaetaceae bacterium]
MIKENFHTHLHYCGHAVGEAADYIKQAKQLGFTAIGFSEHVPYPESYNDYEGFYNGARPPFTLLNDYLNEVNKAKENGQVAIYTGLEMDINPKLYGYYDELKERLDYCIGVIHFLFYNEGYEVNDLPDDGAVFNYLILLTEAVLTKRFSFIGHPDRFAINNLIIDRLENYYELWRIFVMAAVSAAIPLELNTAHVGYGLYDNEAAKNLWRIAAEEGAGVIINSDSHQPKDLNRYFTEAYAMADELGLKVIRFSESLNK